MRGGTDTECDKKVSWRWTEGPQDEGGMSENAARFHETQEPWQLRWDPRSGEERKSKVKGDAATYLISCASGTEGQLP